MPRPYDDALLVAQRRDQPAGRQAHQEVGAEEGELDQHRLGVAQLEDRLQVRNQDVVQEVRKPHMKKIVVMHRQAPSGNRCSGCRRRVPTSVRGVVGDVVNAMVRSVKGMRRLGSGGRRGQLLSRITSSTGTIVRCALLLRVAQSVEQQLGAACRPRSRGAVETVVSGGEHHRGLGDVVEAGDGEIVPGPQAALGQAQHQAQRDRVVVADRRGRARGRSRNSAAGPGPHPAGSARFRPADAAATSRPARLHRFENSRRGAAGRSWNRAWPPKKAMRRWPWRDQVFGGQAGAALVVHAPAGPSGRIPACRRPARG